MKKTIFVRVALITLSLFLALAMTSCERMHKKDQKTLTTVTAKTQVTTTHLYFTGTVQPIDVHAVTSEVDGIVDKVYFHYGAMVKKGARLFVIDSATLETDFQTALADFVSKKQALEDAQRKFSGDQELWDAKLLDENTYKTDQSAVATAQLALLQSQQKLDTIIKTAGVLDGSIAQLSLKNIAAVKKVLTYPYGKLTLIAPSTGVALFPPKSDGGGDGGSAGGCQNLIKACAVKKEQVLMVIGDVTGLTSDFSVSETDVNRLKAGMPVTVTGPGFPGITLRGKIVNVNRQAKKSDSAGGGAAEFPVKIVVQQLTQQEQNVIHVGMSVKIDVALKNPPRILIPISAVFEKDGADMVNVLDPTSGKEKAVQVKTGDTTLDKVVILEGIKDGDKVVVP